VGLTGVAFTKVASYIRLQPVQYCSIHSILYVMVVTTINDYAVYNACYGRNNIESFGDQEA